MNKGDLVQKVYMEIIDSNGNSSKEETLLISDEVLNVCIKNANGKRSLGSITCLPDRIDELVTGILYRKGIISAYSDIVSINVNKECAYDVLVILKDSADIWKEKELLPLSASAEYRSEWIFSLAKTFFEDTPLHKETGATHSCILAKGEKILFSVEDSGRHNAVDKAVGYAVINETDLEKCMIFTSARVSYEMVGNVINAGIPLLISKSIPTLKAVELARKYKLSLICRTKDDSFCKFS